MESKWVSEIAENCQGVKLVLVALKCDLREKHSDDDDDDEVGESDTVQTRKEKQMIDYKQGLEVAKRIQALRYLGKKRSGWARMKGTSTDNMHRMLGETE